MLRGRERRNGGVNNVGAGVADAQGVIISGSGCFGFGADRLWFRRCSQDPLWPTQYGNGHWLRHKRTHPGLHELDDLPRTGLIAKTVPSMLALRSGQQFLDNFAVNISQAEIATLETIG